MKNEICALFSACAIKDGKLFCVTDVEHIFEWIDIKSGKVEYIDDPKGYIPGEWSGTGNILLDEEYAYLLEQNGTRIMKYSFLNQSCQYIALNINDYVCSNFAGSAIWKDKLYIFPRFRDRVIKVKIKSGSIEDNECLCPELEYVFDDKEAFPNMLFSCGYQMKNKMWLFTERDHIVINYDLSEERFERYCLPDSIDSCVHVAWGDEGFYVLSREGKIFLWSIIDNSVRELYDFGREKQYPYFGTLFSAGDSLWILPACGEHIYKIDLINGIAKVYGTYPRDFKYCAPENWNKYYTNYEDEQHIYFAMHSGNYILSIDKSNGQETWIQLQQINKERKLDFILRNKRERLQYETNNNDVADLIGLLKRDYKEEKTIDRESAGRMIWNLTGGK